MESVIRYPIGTQSFEKLRMRGCVYVDKTKYVYDLVNSGMSYFFLSRPRRFGKSLLLSTFDAFFKGKKHLFEGLYIYDKQEEWDEYPVLHFDLSGSEAKDYSRLESYILSTLRAYEKEYDVFPDSENIGIGNRFGQLIVNIHAKTGRQVVILIDEYDNGIIEVLDNKDNLERNQDLLRPFFSQMKRMDSHIRFAFLTGVARFSHYTIFSGINNLKDLSMDNRYGAICGITDDELRDSFGPGIEKLAAETQMSVPDVLEKLRLMYDGYRFTSRKTLVYNPFSILNCLDSSNFGNYWIKTGGSKVFLTYLAKSDFDLTELLNMWCSSERMEAGFSEDDPIPLLYQSGYLTITEVDGDLYKLGIPNGEVRSALVEELIPRYMGLSRTDTLLHVNEMKKSVATGDVDALMCALRAMFSAVPNSLIDKNEKEKTFHLFVYAVCLGIGINAQCEYSCAGGRADLVITTPRYVYVIEFKIKGTSEDAIKQIDSREYTLPWQGTGREIFKIGVVFNPETRNISSWKTETE